MERLKGIPLKLIAIDQFLDENEKWFGKIVFAMIGTRALNSEKHFAPIKSKKKHRHQCWRTRTRLYSNAARCEGHGESTE